MFSVRGATWFLGVSERLFGALLFWGLWNKKAGILGALGSRFPFIVMFTIVPSSQTDGKPLLADFQQ